MPLRYRFKTKLLITFIAFGLAVLLELGIQNFSLWLGIGLPVLLLGIVTAVLVNRLGHSIGFESNTLPEVTDEITPTTDRNMKSEIPVDDNQRTIDSTQKEIKPLNEIFEIRDEKKAMTQSSNTDVVSYDARKAGTKQSESTHIPYVNEEEDFSEELAKTRIKQTVDQKEKEKQPLIKAITNRDNHVKLNKDDDVRKTILQELDQQEDINLINDTESYEDIEKAYILEEIDPEDLVEDNEHTKKEDRQSFKGLDDIIEKD